MPVVLAAGSAALERHRLGVLVVAQAAQTVLAARALQQISVVAEVVVLAAAEASREALAAPAS